RPLARRSRRSSRRRSALLGACARTPRPDGAGASRGLLAGAGLRVAQARRGLLGDAFELAQPDEAGGARSRIHTRAVEVVALARVACFGQALLQDVGGHTGGHLDVSLHPDQPGFARSDADTTGGQITGSASL